jgi:hypothetical protein
MGTVEKRRPATAAFGVFNAQWSSAHAQADTIAVAVALLSILAVAAVALTLRVAAGPTDGEHLTACLKQAGF